MANSVCAVFLTDAPIAAPDPNYRAETGAVVDFWGVVRKTEDGSEIAALAYEAHRAMAEHQLQALGEEAVRKFDLMEVRITHRLGSVAAGEASLLVRIGSRHRAAAFEASVWVVDELKKRVPIWKHPVFARQVASSAAA